MGCKEKLIIFCILSILLLYPSYAQDIEIKGFVNDYADVIDPEQEKIIGSMLKTIYDSDIAQYSIVTIDSLEGKDIESYSIDLAQGNLGDTEKNNGLLLLISVQDRKYRFEVGRGLEYILNDAKVGRIGREYLVPELKQGNYAKGITLASKEIQDILLEGSDINQTTDNNIYQESIDDEQVIAMTLIFMMILFIFIGNFFYRRKKGDKYFDAAMGAIILFGGRGRGGFGGGGFGGGGFGGFGGGGFGGGGASGGF